MEGRKATFRERFSPTNLATYHHNHCELYLWNIYHGAEHHGQVQQDIPPLTRAHFDRGNDWEDMLVAWLDGQELLLMLVAPNLTGNDLSSIVMLDERDHFFVYGLKFQSPDFRDKFEHYGNGERLVNFGVAKPDFIEFTRLSDGKLKWQVIDAKASKETKTSHHVQIYWYHLCLARMLSNSEFAPADTASVWLQEVNNGTIRKPSLDTLHSVQVSLLGPPLEDFFFRQLPEIVHRPSQEGVPWHFNPLCRGCTYEDECRERAIKTKTLGAMPNVSLTSAATLRSFTNFARMEHGITGEPVHELSDLEDLDQICRDRDLMTRLWKKYPSTVRGVKRILNMPINSSSSSSRLLGSSRVTAALEQRPQIINKRSYTFPRKEDIAVIISLVLDPRMSCITAYNISTFVSRPLPIDPNLLPIFGTLSESLTALATKLASHLEVIMDLSESSAEPLQTQVYTFSVAESNALQQYLINIALTETTSEANIGDTFPRSNLLRSVKTCIGALCEGAGILVTAFQPLVLSGALLDFLHKKSNLSKGQLQLCLKRLGIPAQPSQSMESMRVALEIEIARLKAEGLRGGGKFELGQLPRIVVLKREIERFISLSIPGYWELPEAVMSLLSRRRMCPSDDMLFSLYCSSEWDSLKASMSKRDKCTYDLLHNVRRRLDPRVTGAPLLLLNEAKPISSNFMDICHAEPLKKLFFMHQFEVLARLQNLWQSRIDGCPEAPIIEYLQPIYLPTKNGMSQNLCHAFRLHSGILEKPSEKDVAMYAFILTRDEGNEADPPVEAFFDDLAVSGLVFPLNKYTQHRWSSQHPFVREKLAVVDIRDINIQDRHSEAILSMYCESTSFKLVPGERYRLSPRLVDFNTSKVLNALVEIDLDYETGDVAPPFLKLLTNPASQSEVNHESSTYLKAEQAIHRLYKELRDLGDSSAGSLILKSSQRQAARRILSSNLAVVWGPPGTGKTYTITLSLLRMLDVEATQGDLPPKIILMTAMTHAAIEAILSKIHTLIGHYRNIPNLPRSWLDDISLQHLKAGSTHPLPGAHRVHIYAGTVFQLWHFTRRLRKSVDVLIVDEAGQMCLGFLALVMRSLSAQSKLVVAGDNEQLAPIFSALYPQSEVQLFGSILDFLMQLFSPSNMLSTSSNHNSYHGGLLIPSDKPESVISSSQISTVVQLLENFRLNADLGAFISTIYSQSFLPQKSQSRQVATQLMSLQSDVSHGVDMLDTDVCELLVSLGKAMVGNEQSIFKPPVTVHKATSISLYPELELSHRPISLALLHLKVQTLLPLASTSYETHVQGEAALAAALVRHLQRCAPEEDIFVAAPHRIQRHAVAIALQQESTSEGQALVSAFQNITLGSNEQLAPSKGKTVVDTIERLQGSEAAFVICLFSHTHSETLTTTALSFLLNRRRLNVAISRAKTLCIMISSEEVLRPRVAILTDAEATKGYAYLRAFEERAWNANIQIEI